MGYIGKTFAVANIASVYKAGATCYGELLSCRTCFKEDRVGLGQVRPATKSYYLVVRVLRKTALV